MAGDKKDKIKPWGPAADKKKENQEDEGEARFADPNAIGKYAKEWQEPVRKGIEHIATQVTNFNAASRTTQLTIFSTATPSSSNPGQYLRGGTA